MRDRRNGWGKTNKVGLGGVGEVHVLAGRGRKFSKMGWRGGWEMLLLENMYGVM